MQTCAFTHVRTNTHVERLHTHTHTHTHARVQSRHTQPDRHTHVTAYARKRTHTTPRDAHMTLHLACTLHTQRERVTGRIRYAQGKHQVSRCTCWGTKISFVQQSSVTVYPALNARSLTDRILVHNMYI